MKQAVIALVCVLLVAGCTGGIEGSGKSATEVRRLASFESLEVDCSADVTVTAGQEVKCSVTADDNILPLILTECRSNVLSIRAAQGYSTRLGVKITIEVPLLTRVSLNGSGDIMVSGVTKNAATLVINGSGDITAKGQVKELTAEIAGSGNMHASSLEANVVTATIDGSGSADVRASDAITASVNGSGNIIYLGKPPQVRTSKSGSGTIMAN